MVSLLDLIFIVQLSVADSVHNKYIQNYKSLYSISTSTYKPVGLLKCLGQGWSPDSGSSLHCVFPNTFSDICNETPQYSGGYRDGFSPSSHLKAIFLLFDCIPLPNYIQFFNRYYIACYMTCTLTIIQIFTKHVFLTIN